MTQPTRSWNAAPTSPGLSAQCPQRLTERCTSQSERPAAATDAGRHFARAVELQHGQSPAPYVALATGVAVASESRAEFQRLLAAALAIDPRRNPGNDLLTVIYQRRARVLLGQIDRIFGK